MERPTALHHLAIRVLDGLKTCELFRRCYGFQVVATRRTRREQQWVLRCGREIFIVVSEARVASELASPARVSAAAATATATAIEAAVNTAAVTADADALWLYYPSEVGASYAGDTVYDVCLMVKSVAEVLARIPDKDEITTPLRRVEDEHGFVEYAVVKSCIGNVYHTILNKDGYCGTFLPGFAEEPRGAAEELTAAQPAFQRVDHLAYCVEQGRTPAVLDWYERRFGMKRFFMNRTETTSAGCELDSIKLRMYAMEYWKCAETGLSMSGGGTGFVVGETMDPTVKNQITTFLENHGGPGVQHVAFYTHDILAAAADLRRKGVLLVEPPSVYYSEPDKHKEILDVGICPEQLEAAGVLLDTEADCESRSDSYLLQVFTQQVFTTNIFFLELIQRHGSRGFGAGNVTALFRAFERYLADKKCAAVGEAGSLAVSHVPHQLPVDGRTMPGAAAC